MRLVRVTEQAWVDVDNVLAVEQGLGNFTVVHLRSGARVSVVGVTPDEVVTQMERAAARE